MREVRREGGGRKERRKERSQNNGTVMDFFPRGIGEEHGIWIHVTWALGLALPIPSV